MERVRATHEDGGASLGPDYSADSRGWRYDWSEDESRKNLLRTHTTAVSSRTLYKIAQLAKENGGKFKPQKYFSIDRVFRNEALDATHLAEFHQARDAPPRVPGAAPSPAAAAAACLPADLNLSRPSLRRSRASSSTATSRSRT